MNNIKKDKKTILTSFILLILSILLIPQRVLSEEPKVKVNEFRIVGNTVIDIDTIRSRLIKMGIKAKVEQGLRQEKIKEKKVGPPLIPFPIPLPPVTVEELKKEEIEKKEFEKLVEEKVEAPPVLPPVTVEELKKEEIEKKEFEKLVEEKVEAPPVLPPVTVEELKKEEIEKKEFEKLVEEVKELPPLPPEEGYSLEELKNIANIITMLYEENRYILARAHIPQQEFQDGIVTIAVVEGELGDIRVYNNKYYSMSYIRGWFKHLQGKPVKEDEVERAILLANDTPSLNAETIFESGEKPETTDLRVNVKDKYPVQLELEYNNYGNPLVSRQKFGANLKLTDPIFGSTLSLRGIRGDSLKDTFYGQIDYSVPVNHHGTTVGARYITADYIVGKEFSVLDVQGETKIIGGYITHPFIKSRADNLKATLGFDYKRMFEYMVNEQRSNDDLSVAYLRLDADSLDSRLRGKNYLSLTYSQGFEEFLGSLRKDDEVASRRPSDGGEFSKLNLDYARVQWVPGNFILLLKTSAQYTLNRLVSSEQFGIGGANTVRGHALSTYLGDNGYLVSAEVSPPLPFIGEKKIFSKKISELFQAVLFVDHGGVYKNDPVDEAKNEYLTSMGFGARLNLFDRFNIKVDVGYPFREHELKTQHEIVYIQGTLQVLRF